MDKDEKAIRSQYRQALLDRIHKGRRTSDNLEERFRGLGLTDPVMADLRKDVQIELFSETDQNN